MTDQWIDVKKQSPPLLKWILAYCPHYKQKSKIYIYKRIIDRSHAGGQIQNTYMDQDGLLFNDSVTHWQPLPEPPVDED